LVGLRIFVEKWVAEHLIPLSNIADDTLDTWLDNSRYTTGRKNQIKNAVQEISLINPDKYYTKLHAIKSFIKSESYSDIKHSRCINARNDIFKGLVGPIFHLIEHALFQLEYFIKYVPVDERAKHIHENLYAEGGEYMATDFSHFESHFNPTTLRNIEFILYRHMVKNLANKHFFLLLIYDVLLGKNTCTFKNVKCSVLGTRMSGEMNTSLGNGFSNLMLILYNFHRMGLPAPPCRVEGDDGIIRVGPKRPTSHMFAECGFEIKLEIFKNLNEAAFCGLTYDPINYAIMGEPMKKLLNFGWLSELYVKSTEKKLRQLLLSKSISSLINFPNCPILTEMALMGIRCSKQKYAVNHGATSYERKTIAAQHKIYKNYVPKIILTSTRLLFEKIYGWSVTEQLQVEKYFLAITNLKPIEHPSIDDRLKSHEREYWQNYVLQYSMNNFKNPVLWVPTENGQTTKKSYGQARCDAEKEEAAAREKNSKESPRSTKPNAAK
jgi:hypothetical protein